MSTFQQFYDLKTEEKKEDDSPIHFPKPQVLHIILEEYGLKEPKNLRYFKKPNLPLNLNLGFENFNFRDESFFQASPKILENFLMENNGRQLLQNKEKQKVLTSRRALTLIMTSPYGMYDKKMTSWTIKAVKFANIIYLVNDCEEHQDKQLRLSYHAKFQQYCYVDAPNEQPNISDPIDENKQTFCVFQTSLKDFDILYTARMSGVESELEIPNFTDPNILNECRFVSTKLNGSHTRSFYKNNKKMLKWWIQAKLGRVDDIYIGFKTKNGFIYDEIEHLKVEDLPNGQKWNPETCVHFLNTFLKKLQLLMSDVDDLFKVFEFKFSSKDKNITYRSFDADKDKHPFLTNEFIEYIQENI